MHLFEVMLLVFLVVCAISVCLIKNLLSVLIVFMTYSLAMAVLWVLLRSPDLAITEAAVGAGVTSIIFFVMLYKVNALKGDDKDEQS